MQDTVIWPKFGVADPVVEKEVGEIYDRMHSMAHEQEIECQRLRERVEALEARVPARSWLGALMACLRAQRYGRHA